MLLSAYGHGLHPGYYLSFLTIPLCLAAEGRLESALRWRLGPGGQQAWDWVHWFLKMRAYDYMCMGFVGSRPFPSQPCPSLLSSWLLPHPQSPPKCPELAPPCAPEALGHTLICSFNHRPSFIQPSSFGSLGA